MIATVNGERYRISFQHEFSVPPAWPFNVNGPRWAVMFTNLDDRVEVQVETDDTIEAYATGRDLFEALDRFREVVHWIGKNDPLVGGARKGKPHEASLLRTGNSSRVIKVRTTCRIFEYEEPPVPGERRRDATPVFTGVSYCSLSDNFGKPKARRDSLERALADEPKEVRTAFWNAYINRGPQPSGEREDGDGAGSLNAAP